MLPLVAPNITIKKENLAFCKAFLFLKNFFSDALLEFIHQSPFTKSRFY